MQMRVTRNPLEEAGRFLKSGDILPRLIMINIILWLFTGIVKVISYLFNLPDSSAVDFIVNYLALPAYPGSLAYRPWTLITYMFLHIDFFHILFNMLWLYWFGKIFLEFMRQKQLLWVYLLGGIAGGLLYILFYNIFPVFEKFLEQSVALGASASVMAIVTAISFYVPGYTIQLLFLGRVRIIYIAIVLFILDFFMIRSDNAGGHIAHIGGAIFGFSYILAKRKGMNFSWLWLEIKSSRLLRAFRRRPLKTSRDGDTSFYGRPLTDEKFNQKKAERQKRIDQILDKISKSGYESLSKEDKEILFKSGEKD